MGGLLLGAGSLVLLFPVLLVLGLLVVVALQRDDDVDGNRAPAIYGAIVAFVSFLGLLYAVGLAAAAIVDFSKDTYGDGHDAQASQLVIAVIVGLIAAGVLVLH